MKPQNFVFSGEKKSPKNSCRGPGLLAQQPWPWGGTHWTHYSKTTKVLTPAKTAANLKPCKGPEFQAHTNWCVALRSQDFPSAANKIGKWWFLWAKKHLTLEQTERRTDMVATKGHLHTTSTHQTGANSCILKRNWGGWGGCVSAYVLCQMIIKYRCKQDCIVLLSINKYTISSK